MAATPFKGIISYTEVATGKPGSLRFSASDVANAFATWTDLAGTPSSFQVPVASGGYRITDLFLTAAGVDTTSLQVIKDQASLPVFIQDTFAANATAQPGSRAGPVFAKTLAPGSSYALKQLA